MFKEIDEKKVEKEAYAETVRRYDDTMERFEHYFEKLFAVQEEHGKILAEVKTKVERLEWLIKSNNRH